MTDWQILIVALTMYIIGNVIAYIYKIKWLHFGLAVLWFVPIVMIDNIYIQVFSGIMILISGLVALSSNREDYYE